MIDIIAMCFVFLGRWYLMNNKKRLTGIAFLIADVLFLIFGIFILSIGLIGLSGVIGIFDLKMIIEGNESRKFRKFRKYLKKELLKAEEKNNQKGGKKNETKN
jgi:hypothetical protein